MCRQLRSDRLGSTQTAAGAGAAEDEEDARGRSESVARPVCVCVCVCGVECGVYVCVCARVCCMWCVRYLRARRILHGSGELTGERAEVVPLDSKRADRPPSRRPVTAASSPPARMCVCDSRTQAHAHAHAHVLAWRKASPKRQQQRLLRRQSLRERLPGKRRGSGCGVPGGVGEVGPGKAGRVKLMQVAQHDCGGATGKEDGGMESGSGERGRDKRRNECQWRTTVQHCTRVRLECD